MRGYAKNPKFAVRRWCDERPGAVSFEDGDHRILEEISFWSRCLTEDRLRLATTPAERLDAIREHRNRMVVHERLTGDSARAGSGRVLDALKGRYYRLEADQLLAEAGVDPVKEPPVTAPEDNPESPPASPSPTPAIPR